MTPRRTSLEAAPVLQTERLVLRPHAAGDFESVCALWEDPQVVRHILGRPSTREESWARLLRYAGHWMLLGFGFWAITRKDGGRFIGEIGMADFRREMSTSLEGDPEMGWVLSPHAHGKGYATEAASAALAWSDRELRCPTTCMIDPENRASIRVAEKLGFTELARSTYKGEPTVLYRRSLPG
jgi:RimJ/RimL family protein N-acetyltransferase